MKTASHSQEIILKLLELSDRPMSAQDIWTELEHQGQKLGIATVYRNLETIKLKGLVQIRTSHNEAFYSLILSDRCFATCLQCGESVSLETPLPKDLKHPTLQSQFEVYYHTLEVFGLCSPCKSGSAV